MRVYNHGCDVKMFCFSRANHASAHEFEKVLHSKLDKFTSYTHSIHKLALSKPRAEYLKRSFSCSGAALRNSLPQDLRVCN